MDLIVYDTSFNPLGLIDTYDSLIWTERLYSCGDFELSLAPTAELFSILRKDYYIWNPNAVDVVSSADTRRKIMIIEGLEIQTDVETGNKLIVTGRSLESILDRRIVWKQTEIDSYLQTAVQRLLNENIISPSSATGGSSRQISNFIFETSSDPLITSLRLSAQFTGDNLYDVISQICSDNNIGFKITLNDSNQFCFKLIAGLDRSYGQTSNPYVCFSSSFENIINSNYQTSKSALKNITRIGGEGEGNDRTFATFYNEASEPSGLTRREVFTDARDLSTKSYDDQGEEKTLTAEEYQAILKERGAEDLSECLEVEEFESEIDATQQYKLGVDFSMGDYVQIVNEYGIEGTALITEIVTSIDSNGTSYYPAFVLVKSFDDEYDRLNYIESTGTQYIDTEIVTSNSFIANLKCIIPQHSTPGTVIGSAWSQGAFLIHTNGTSNHFTAYTGMPYASISYSVDTILNINMRLGNVNVNGTDYTTGTSPSSYGNCLLFNAESYYVLMKLYECELHNGSLLVRNFIPAKRKADNKPGLYDSVTRKFYTNQGTGEFLYG